MNRESRIQAGARALFEDCFPGLSWDDSDPLERPVWVRQAKLVHDAIFPPAPFRIVSSTWPVSV